MTLGQCIGSAVALCAAAGTLGAAAPVKLLVKDAMLFTMEAGQEKPFRGYFTVGEDGRIATLAPGDAPSDLQATTTLDAKGAWVLPGFVSAHSHLWQSAYRGIAADQTLMGWVNGVYMEQAMKAEPGSFYWFTLHGALDHLRHGITAAYNFNYGGWRAGDFTEQQYRGEVDSGIRFVHGYNAMTMDGDLQSSGASLEREREAMKTFFEWLDAQPKTDRLLSVMINGAAGFNNNPEQTKIEAALANEFGVGNQVHYLEWPPGQEEERSRFRWFVDYGLLGPKVVFGHFIHTDDWILSETVKAGATMAWNPLSNGRLASGTADIPHYLKMGLKIGMGVDGQASADRADPFENMRVGLYAVRAKYGDATVLSPYDVVHMHTIGSAEVLGADDRIGSLKTGKFADFIMVDTSDLGVVFDPYATLVFVTGSEHLQQVWIGGEQRYANGALNGQNFDRIRAEVDQRVALFAESSTKSQ